MTVAQLIELLQRHEPSAPVAILRPKRRANRLDDPEYEALDVLGVESGRRTSVSSTFNSQTGAMVVALRSR